MLEIGINSTEVGARIIVVGVGDAGSQSVNRMIDEGIENIEFIGVNTDNSNQQHCKTPVRLQIGGRPTGGLMETSPKIGEKAAEESAEDISAALRGADMVLVICSMGGNMETGAAPVIAQLAKDKGILTVGIGAGRGKEKALDAARMAAEGLDHTVSLADIAHIILYVSGDIALADANYAVDHVQKIVGEEVNILLGIRLDASEADCCTVMVIVKIQS